MRKTKLIKTLSLLMTASMLLISFVGCNSSKSSADDYVSSSSSSKEDKDSETLVSNPQEDVIKETDDMPVATMKVKDYGTVKIILYPTIAPNTVNNFISLANSGFYDGLTFHRIISNFMIQGGDPKGDGTGGPDYSIKGEFSSNGVTNDLKHKIGVISMARSQANDSAGSQFFIMTSDSDYLDGQYAAFGRVIEGMDIVSKIRSVDTDSNDKPKKDVVIESIKVDTKGQTYPEPEKINN